MSIETSTPTPDSTGDEQVRDAPVEHPRDHDDSNADASYIHDNPSRVQQRVIANTL